MSVSVIGITNGLTRPGPLVRSTSCSSSSVVIPPWALPITHATLWPFSAVTSNPAQVSASRAATIANCANRSVRFASLRSICAAASKSFTSPATCDTYPSGSNRVIRAVPDLAFTRASQLASTEWPMGVIMPIPVTTTRLFTAEEYRQRPFAASGTLPVSVSPRRLPRAPQHSQGPNPGPKLRPPL